MHNFFHFQKTKISIPPTGIIIYLCGVFSLTEGLLKTENGENGVYVCLTHYVRLKNGGICIILRLFSCFIQTLSLLLPYLTE